MYLDWHPSEHFPTLARQAGIPSPDITPEAIAEFRSYWFSRQDEKTQHEWDHKLLTSLKTSKARAAGQKPPGGGARASPRGISRDEGRAIAASTRLSDFRAAVAADQRTDDERTLETPATPRLLG